MRVYIQNTDIEPICVKTTVLRASGEEAVEASVTIPAYESRIVEADDSPTLIGSRKIVIEPCEE